MQAGKLQHRVTVQVRSMLADSYGQASVGIWSDVGTFWAYVRPLSGREAVVAKQVLAEATAAVTMRHQGSTSITTSHRLLFRGRVLNIVQVNNVDENDRQLELLCQEVS